MRTCRNCRHFLANGHELERMFPGLAVLSSGYGAARADTGLCRRHEVMGRSDGTCAEFQPSE